MTFGKFCGTAVAVVLAASCLTGRASASGLTYTCDSSVDATAAGTCAYLNGTIANLYNGTFNNVNANIYIEQGIIGLGGSATARNYISYSDYLSVLTGTGSGSSLDTSALASLHSFDDAVYGSDNVVAASALLAAMGYTNVAGYTSGLTPCTIGVSSGCYNGVIIITTPANLASETGQSLYYRQLGGSQAANAYDYYSIVEHETDEILGTTSCMSTQSSTLSDPCDPGTGAPAGTGTPSASDLFRYNAVGSLALNNAYIGLVSAPAGAYFSYDGGVTGGPAFNTISNGSDYADFATTCSHVQDATGCPGGSFDITTDGNAEINMLDAVGYNLAAPEPGTLILLGAGLAAMCLLQNRRKQVAIQHRSPNRDK